MGISASEISALRRVGRDDGKSGVLGPIADDSALDYVERNGSQSVQGAEQSGRLDPSTFTRSPGNSAPPP